MPDTIDKGDDIERISFKCKILNKDGEYKKRYAILSDYKLYLYRSQKDCVKPKLRVELDSITSVYINPSEDQLCLKRVDTPNIILVTDLAVDVLRVLYALRYYACEISVYQVRNDDLEEYMENPKLPSKKYRVQRPTFDEGFDDSDEDCNADAAEKPSLGMDPKQKVN